MIIENYPSYYYRKQSEDASNPVVAALQDKIVDEKESLKREGYIERNDGEFTKVEGNKTIKVTISSTGEIIKTTTTTPEQRTPYQERRSRERAQKIAGSLIESGTTPTEAKTSTTTQTTPTFIEERYGTTGLSRDILGREVQPKKEGLYTPIDQFPYPGFQPSKQVYTQTPTGEFKKENIVISKKSEAQLLSQAKDYGRTKQAATIVQEQKQMIQNFNTKVVSTPRTSELRETVSTTPTREQVAAQYAAANPITSKVAIQEFKEGDVVKGVVYAAPVALTGVKEGIVGGLEFFSPITFKGEKQIPIITPTVELVKSVKSGELIRYAKAEPIQFAGQVGGGIIVGKVGGKVLGKAKETEAYKTSKATVSEGFEIAQKNLPQGGIPTIQQFKTTFGIEKVKTTYDFETKRSPIDITPKKEPQTINIFHYLDYHILEL